MEKNLCEICKNPSELCCSCDNMLRFCSNCYTIHKILKGNHEPISLDQINLTHKLQETIENLNKTKSQVISISNQLIDIIQSIATNKLSLLDKCINACRNTSKSKAFDAEETIKIFQNIKVRHSFIETFKGLANEYFLFIKLNTEKIDADLEILLKEIKQDSQKFSANSEEIKKKLQSKSLFLEGHSGEVNSITLTNDNKYMITGSSDTTVRV